MNVFIYSPKKAPIFINGYYICIAGPNVVGLHLSKGDLVEVRLAPDLLPSRCVVGADFCENMSIIDLYEGFLLIPNIKKNNCLPYKHLFFDSVVSSGVEHLFNVYVDGEPRLTCQGFHTYRTISLPFVPKEFSASNIGGDLFMATMKDKLKYFVIFSSADLSIVFFDICDDFTVDKGLTVEKTHRLIGVHKESAHYSYNGKMNLDGKVFTSSYPYSPIPEALFPLCFLEEVRLSADYRHFLSEDLAKDHSLISEFLGGFSLCLPPFLPGFEDNYILISDRAKFVKLACCNGHITDISCENFPF